MTKHATKATVNPGTGFPPRLRCPVGWMTRSRMSLENCAVRHSVLLACLRDARDVRTCTLFLVHIASSKAVPDVFGEGVRGIEKFIIRQPPMGEKDDYDSENSWISDGLPAARRTPLMPCKIKGRLGFFGRRLPRRTPVAHKLFGCVWLAALSLCGPLLERCPKPGGL